MTKMQWKSKLLSWTICAALIGLTVSLPIEHTKLRRSTGHEEVQWEKTGKYLVITKRKNETGIDGASPSKLSEYLELHSNSFQVAAGDSSPVVYSHSNIGIGYEVDLNEAALKQVLEIDEVSFVEPDYKIQGAVTQYPIELGWHTDRIDQRYQPLDGKFSPKYTGKGVDIYILDSGISYSHQVFGGRAQFGGYDYFNGNGEDCHGHGTHCAGLAAGKVTGVAYEANIYSIRVLDCNNGGSFAGVIAGINEATNRRKSSGRPTIISMSLIGPKSEGVDEALKVATEAGVIPVVAAGNYRLDACDFSPSSSYDVITVGGTQEDGDQLYWFDSSSSSPGTNFGKCVDIFAPGQWIRSAYHLSDSTLVSMSGTSMATPIAAGAAALILQESPNCDLRCVKDKMQASATPGVLDFRVLSPTAISETPNLLVYIDQGGSCVSCTTATTTTPPPTTPTTAPQTTTSTTVPPNEPSQTTSTPPTPASTVPTLPPTTPLPQAEGQAVDAVLESHIASNVDGWKAAGYAPVNINAYEIRGNQYFTIVYEFVGTSTAVQYYLYSDLSINSANYYIQYQPAYLQVRAMAAYNKNGQGRMVVVFGPASGVRVTSLDKSSQEWFKEVTEMNAMSYYPVCIRFSQGDSGSRVHTIYEKDTATTFEWGLTLNDLQKRIDDLSLHQSTFVIDLSYEVTPNGDAQYTAVFNKDRFGGNLFHTDLQFDRYGFYYSNTALKASNYHAVAMTPIIQKNADPGYFTAYWR